MYNPIIKAILFILTLGGTITITQIFQTLFEFFMYKSGGSEYSRMTKRTNTTSNTVVEEFAPAYRWS